MDGFHDKLKILPFDSGETVQAGIPTGPPFIAQFNPETFSIGTEVNLGEEKAQGDTGSEAKFFGISPRTFSFDLLLDSTGAAGPGPALDVFLQIKLFKMTVGFHGPIHRPNFLLIQWGTFLISAAIESYTINFKLFRPDGSPLRAVINASFKEHLPGKLRELLKNLSSPDLTHLHSVNTKDHLSLLTHNIYKSPDYYFHVGEANGLNNLRKLKRGATLEFPPMEK